MRRVLALGVLSRLLVLVVATVAGSAVAAWPDGTWNAGPAAFRYLARWDSGFYLDIAALGYGYRPDAWAFSPGSPLAIAGVHRALPFLHPVAAGVLVSHAAFLGTLPIFYGLTRRLFDDAVAWRASVILIVTPSSFYLSAVYADALFLLLLVATFVTLHDEQWLAAGAFAGVAAFTRPNGVVLLGALGLGVLVHWVVKRRPPWQAFAMPVVAVIPSAAFMTYAFMVTGDPLVSWHAREVHWPHVGWHVPFKIGGMADAPFPAPFVAFLLLLGLAATVAWTAVDVVRSKRWRAIPVYGFTGVLAVVYISYAEVAPIVRYLAAVLPLPWVLAHLAPKRAVFASFVAVLAAAQALTAVFFARWLPMY